MATKPRLFTVTLKTISLSRKCHSNWSNPFGSIFSVRVQLWWIGGCTSAEAPPTSTRHSQGSTFCAIFLIIYFAFVPGFGNQMQLSVVELLIRSLLLAQKTSNFYQHSSAVKLSLPLRDAYVHSTDARSLLKGKNIFWPVLLARSLFCVPFDTARHANVERRRTA